MAHRSADTMESIREIVLSAVEDIKAGRLVGAFSLHMGGSGSGSGGHQEGGEHILFSHAGINARFFKYITEKVGSRRTGISNFDYLFVCMYVCIMSR